MGLIKREYKDRETLITAKNMNDIQDAVIALEDGLFSVDNNRSGEVIAITDAAKRGFRSLNIFGRTTQGGTPTPDAPMDLVSVGDGGSISVHVCGKNLFTGWIVGGITEDGADYGGTNTRRTNYLPISTPAQKYMVSGIPNTLYTMAAFYDVNKSFISRTVGGNFGNSRLLEPPHNARYFRFAIYESTSTSGKIAEADAMANVTMIEAGTVVTQYEPTQSAIVSAPNGLPGIPVTSGGNYTDANGQQWICDEIDLARGVYVQRVSEYIAPTFASSGTASGNVYLYSTFLFETINEMNTKVLSTHFGWVASGALADMSVGQMIVRDRTDHPVIYCASTIATESEFNAWVQENNVRFLSILAAPIVTPLSEEELVAYAALYTYKDSTTVSNDAGAYMELEYVMDAKKYIDGLMTGTIIPATVE